MDLFRLLFAPLLALSLCLAAGPAGAAGGIPIVLAVHPYLSFDELMRRFAPLADFLASRVGRPVSVRVGRSYDDHQLHVGRDRVDIAYLGPASYVRLVANYGPKPLLGTLAARGNSAFRGVIVTRDDGGLSSLQDLRGRRFAFGDPESTMSHLIPRHLMAQQGIQLEDLADYGYLGSHGNVALAVLAGDFDAGAVSEETFGSYRDQGLRDLAWTEPLTEHLFVARADLDADTLGALRQAFSELAGGDTAARIVSSIKKSATGIAPVRDADYDELRAILGALEEAGP